MVNGSFETFSLQHFGALGVAAWITYWAIHAARIGDDRFKFRTGMWLAGITFSSMVIEQIFLLAIGRYDLYNDLPVNLCDLVAIALPFILWHRNRKWVGILYFWALAGTLQALITPDIAQGFPLSRFSILHHPCRDCDHRDLHHGRLAYPDPLEGFHQCDHLYPVLHHRRASHQYDHRQQLQLYPGEACGGFYSGSSRFLALVFDLGGSFDGSFVFRAARTVFGLAEQVTTSFVGWVIARLAIPANLTVRLNGIWAAPLGLEECSTWFPKS